MRNLNQLFLSFFVIFVAACSSSTSTPTLGSQVHEASPQSEQVLLVESRGNTPHAVVTRFEKSSAGWVRVGKPLPAVVGRNGIAPPGAKREGDGRSPSGIFQLGPAFGDAERIDTAMDYRRAGPEDYFVDDVNSPQYNQWVHGETGAKSFEKMKRDDGLYARGLVIQYNMAPTKPGDGSAIFVHIWKNAETGTAGCVALDPSDVATILHWLRPGAHPVVYLRSH